MLTAAFLVLLVLFVYQDVRFKAIHWICFPLLLAGSIAMNYTELNLLFIGLNLGFLLVTLTGLTVYLSLKNGRLENITNGFFSWGDILFLVAITPLFDFQTYLWLFIAGNFISLFLHVVTRGFRSSEPIPYAGYMALVLGVFLLFREPITTTIYQFGSQ